RRGNEEPFSPIPERHPISLKTCYTSKRSITRNTHPNIHYDGVKSNKSNSNGGSLPNLAADLADW
ncbi:hypothetical protein J6590_100108, partial [Homalodisca vitripennis]